MSYENTIEAVSPVNNVGCGGRFHEEYLNTAMRSISNTTDGTAALNNIVPPLELVNTSRPPSIDVSNHASNPDVANNPWPPLVDVNNRLSDVSNNNSANPAESELKSLAISTSNDTTDSTDCSAAPPETGLSPEMMRKGLEQIKAALEKGQYPEGEEGSLVLAHSLESYFDADGKDFIKNFVKDSNAALQASPLKDKVKVGVGEATDKDKADLQKLAAQTGLKVEHSGVIELRDKDGKVTDRRVVGVLTGPQVQAVAVYKP